MTADTSGGHRARSEAAGGHTVLVVGGTGMLGEPVARRMAADGHRVRVLTRRIDAVRDRFAPPFELARGDVEDAGALEAASKG